MPKNATIVLIRHAEKPEDSDTDDGLSVAGQERAMAYTVFFQNWPSATQPLKFSYLFASHQSAHSNRPYLTIQPLATQLNLKINDHFEANEKPDKGLPALVQHLLSDAGFDHSNVLICWHHEQLLELATKLGALPHTLPLTWPGEVYGWLIQLNYDNSGTITSSATIEEQLMFDDYGQKPVLA